MQPFKLIAFLATLALADAPSRAQSGANVPTSSIDSIFQCYSKDKPGGQLAVSLNGQVVYSKAWGMANLETDTPLTSESLIEAGSVSKQFTAGAKLRLVSEASFALIVCAKDRFLIPDLKTDLLFKRNRKNEIIAIELTTPRTLRLRFEKVKPSASPSF